MQIKKVIETNKGIVMFEGEATQEEFDFIFQTGLLYLLQQGSIPANISAETPISIQ